jgi:cyclopropane-fatty-acyl-phospholipid synthase
MSKLLLTLAELGFIPDNFIKIAVRFITKKRLNESGIHENKFNIIKSISEGGIAEKTDDANEQHYEVPPGFFKYALGKNLKYSCSFFDNTDSLDEAEKSMLELYIQRANIQEGQAILDLGCGWGSFSLYVAEKYPSVSITAVSNSKDQITFIQNEAKRRGLLNIKASKMDVNNLDLDNKFDRIVSIEMFEHLRNYKLILKTSNSSSKYLNIS